MALYIRKETPRSELQERIASELQQKLRATSQSFEYEKPVNSVEVDTHESQNLAPILIMVAMVIFVGVAYLLLTR